MINSLYVVGSLRNPKIPEIAANLRSSLGIEVFDDWYAAGPEADDYWRDYEKQRGHDFKTALAGYAAKHVFNFDKTNLDRCDAAVMLMPAGKSAHLEIGYMAGKGKPTFILMDGEPERFDVMYNFVTGVCTSEDEFIQLLRKFND